MSRTLALMLVVSAAYAVSLRADDETPPAPKKVALLVGVNEYLKPGFKALQFAEADVTAVGEELVKLGFDVTILLGSGEGDAKATRDNIEAAARRMVEPLGQNDIALVMLSGHGQQLNPNPDPNQGNVDFNTSESYYCPVDALVNRPESQFSLSLLMDEILAPNVGRKLLLVDACRDVPENIARGARNTKGIEGRVVALPEDTGVFFSCRAGQMSFEREELGHGLFTHCVLEGLREKAVVDGEIAWSSLVAYVDRRMQQPEITRYMPAGLKQVPIPAGAMPYTVLGKLHGSEAPPRGLSQSEIGSIISIVASTPQVDADTHGRILASMQGTIQRFQAGEITSKQRDEEFLGYLDSQQRADFLASIAASRPMPPPFTPLSTDLEPTLTSSIGLKLTLIPAGEFLMGGDQSPDEIVRVTTASGGNTEATYYANEQPQHRVCLTQSFYLGTYEVTQAEWRDVMGSNPSNFASTGFGKARVAGLDTSRCPVETVSWYDAIEFCNRLSQRDGLSPYYRVTDTEAVSTDKARDPISAGNVSVLGGNGYRLPTEAEWEYACRAGATTPFHFGTSCNGTQANVDGNYTYGMSTKGPNLERTTSVGNYAANAFGLYDMHGNVCEWCFDGYDESAYQSRTGTTSDPVNVSAVDRRVLRGGNWYHGGRTSRSAQRVGDTPDSRISGTGFRVARTP
jgi:formylglycine-generating enzyme required for sulfatase activity/uncharacterized caspase-like protein